jgi:hypothetical protein
VRSKCRSEFGTCAPEIAATTAHHDPYPAHVLPAPEHYQQPPQGLLRRQLATVLWSAYAGSCGAVCVIPAGTTVTLDVSMDVTSLSVLGSLVWDTSKSGLTLSAGFVVVEDGGSFTMGTEGAPMVNPATIYLKNNGASHHHNGKRVFGGYSALDLGKSGPVVEVFGRVLSRTWTLLAATANSGATSFTVEHSGMGWQVGDRIAIAPTILPVTSPSGAGYAEVFTIAGISGTTITLSGALYSCLL